MHMNEAGLRLLKNFEGVRLQAYKCPAGVVTIGYGHTGMLNGKPLTMGTTITQAQAEALLKQDLVRYENYVNSLKRDFNENQFSALTSFVYNCGLGSLQMLCRNRNNKQIAEALLLYNKAGGKVLAGLTKRRKAERELFLKPVEGQVKPIQEGQKLPYKVRTKCDLNIRSGAGVTFNKIRVAKKGEVLTVWAIETNGTTKWGKNGKEYFSLGYCEEI